MEATETPAMEALTEQTEDRVLPRLAAFTGLAVLDRELLRKRGVLRQERCMQAVVAVVLTELQAVLLAVAVAVVQAVRQETARQALLILAVAVVAQEAIALTLAVKAVAASS